MKNKKIFKIINLILLIILFCIVIIGIIYIVYNTKKSNNSCEEDGCVLNYLIFKLNSLEPF